MSDITVAKFSESIGVEVDRLLVQMDEAGIKVKSGDDFITDENKVNFLEFLKTKHGHGSDEQVDSSEEEAAAPKKITLKRRSTSELRQKGGARGKTVSVEVRKKRTYVKQGAAPAAEDENGGSEIADRVEEQIESDKVAAAEAEELLKQEEAKRLEEEKRKEEEATKQRELATRLAEEEVKRKAEEEARRKVEEAQRSASGDKRMISLQISLHVKTKRKVKKAVSRNSFMLHITRVVVARRRDGHHLELLVPHQLMSLQSRLNQLFVKWPFLKPSPLLILLKR